ncbi:MAG: cellulase family glycosylhydrolase [Akkermansiaceae bacterium]|nr:cellulase family glycosylhydrolase [Akkermansiaceae bacterium]
MKKNISRIILSLGLTGIIASAHAETTPATNRWSKEQAQQWYDQYPWLVGCNFIPSNAINQLEMFQADTWDEKTNDKELKMAHDLGFNFIRVYLHDLAYQADPKGFLDRVDQFLALADKHEIKVMLVIFDDCWLDDPKVGKQPEPLPGVHNSGWLESPGLKVLKQYTKDASIRKRLETYVKAVLTKFKDDQRVIIWDLYNEPGNRPNFREDIHGHTGKAEKINPYKPLLRDVYIWAREVGLSQPVTTCTWSGNLGREAAENWADVTSFHNYKTPESLQKEINQLKKLGRPIICTEYMGRPRSTFKDCLPILQKENVAAVNWGFVAGKTNTIYGWDTWEKPGKTPEPKVWFHDIYRQDGTPFDPAEIELIKATIRKANKKAK